MKSKVTYHIYSTMLNILLESITLEYMLVNTSSKDQVKQVCKTVKPIAISWSSFPW